MTIDTDVEPGDHVGEQRPFRFGLTTSTAASRQEWIDKARKIESLGYDTIAVSDHFPERLAAVPAIMAAADATTTLRVASWVFCNDFRHPAMLYKEAATIDLLSGGRFELGIGAGWLKSEYDMVGIPFEAPGVRVSRMEEAVHILKGLASDGPFHFRGTHYQFDGLEGAPKPVQEPHIPLYIGGGGKRTLSFAARETDIVGICAKALKEGGLDGADTTAESVHRKVRWIRGAAGERDPELNILIYHFEIADDRQQAAAAYAEQVPGLSASDVLASPHVLIGSVDQIAEDLIARREEFGITYFVINTGVSEHIDQFAPVVAKLSSR